MTLEICAEMSANHLGSFDRAMRIVEAAAEAGAQLLKVQVWEPDTMCLDREYTLDSGPWKGRKLFDLYREAWTPWDWLPRIFERARELGMEPFGAAFDKASVDYLESLHVKRHKVASFELTDLPLIRYMASKDRPMLLSTGMASIQEIDTAMAAARWPSRAVTLLKCTSSYPADASYANLHTYARNQWVARAGWGLSDHTQGIGVAVAAAVLGAVYIEKHLTLSRSDGGPDAGFSMEPAEFKQLVIECRRAAASVGEVRYGPTAGENTTLRRGLWLTRDVEQGEFLELGVNVATARPHLGLPASFDPRGRRATKALTKHTPLHAEDVA